MKRLSVLLFAFFPLLSACNNSSSGGSPKSAEEIQKDEQSKLQNSASATDMTALITPDRIQIVKENMSYEDKGAFYTIGCKTQGQMGTFYQMDPLLQVGSQFRVESGSHSITDDAKSHYRSVETVTNLQPNLISKEENYEFMSLEGTPFSNLDQVFKGRPHSTMTMTFEFRADGSYPKSNYQHEYYLTDTAKSWVASQPQKDFYWYCKVNYDPSQPSSDSYEADEILYNIMGRPVKGYIEKSSSSGEVVCEKLSGTSSSSSEDKPLNVVKLGHGTRTRVAIYTNQVASLNLAECGGVTVFYSSIVKLDSGKIISNRVEKTISAPLR